MEIQKQDVTFKLNVDATEDFKTVAKLKAEIEQIVALQERVKEKTVTEVTEGKERCITINLMIDKQIGPKALQQITRILHQTLFL